MNGSSSRLEGCSHKCLHPHQLPAECLLLEALPDLHKRCVLSFSVQPLTVYPISSLIEAKQPFTQAYGPLVLIINVYEQSGNRKDMLEEDPEER